jgi:hypothetical protein
VIASPGLAFAAMPSELSMSAEHILENVTHLVWASGPIILAIGLGFATFSHRRWANRQESHPPLLRD